MSFELPRVGVAEKQVVDGLDCPSIALGGDEDVSRKRTQSGRLAEAIDSIVSALRTGGIQQTCARLQGPGNSKRSCIRVERAKAARQGNL